MLIYTISFLNDQYVLWGKEAIVYIILLSTFPFMIYENSKNVLNVH